MNISINELKFNIDGFHEIYILVKWVYINGKYSADHILGKYIFRYSFFYNIHSRVLRNPATHRFEYFPLMG